MSAPIYKFSVAKVELKQGVVSKKEIHLTTDITIEYDKDIRARNFIIVLTARVAYEIEEADAVVKYTNIG